jgi:hypothetical protein
MAGGDGKPSKAAEQMRVNVAHYRGVFEECLKAADEIAAGRPMDAETRFKVAQTLFNRLFDDQCQLTEAKMKDDTLRPFLTGIQRALERRGLLA